MTAQRDRARTARAPKTSRLALARAIAYSSSALLSLVIDSRFHNLVLTLCFWAIPPVGFMIGRMRGEDMSTSENPVKLAEPVSRYEGDT